MVFWWASQGKNYDIAIAQGSLWTCPWSDGTLRRDRVLIKQLQRGDIVFHYANGALRAVSKVVDEWMPAARPTGYPKRNDTDLEAGWLARVQPITIGLALDWHDLPSLIALGAPGPLDRNGVPQEKYLSSITDEDALRLLEHLAVTLEPRAADRTLTAAVVDEIWDRGETDAEVIGRRRREQRHLRAHLLEGRALAPCAICGRELPASLLTAAHIVPRSTSDEAHRKDFAAIAMLACSLGCDELFEHGYFFVGGDGLVRAGRAAESDALMHFVEELAGRPCTAYNEQTAQDFAQHAKLVRA